jgi:transcriptional regulator with XRE-family HTH domain
MRQIRKQEKVHWHLKEWREHRQMTQEQLAELIGTNKGQIAKLETGRQRMNDDWLNSIAKALAAAPRQLMASPDAPTLDDLIEGTTREEVETLRRAISMMLKK